MGVCGLQSFLKENREISVKANLQNTTIVIDANNLFCYLYIQQTTTASTEQYKCYVYGGDIVTYSQEVKKFFAALDTCKITPVLVFDGSVLGKPSQQNQQISKDSTVHKRCLNKFDASKTLTDDNLGANERFNEVLIPNIISQAFKNVVKDLGVETVQSPFEADANIARVANELNCPVLTNDSDFIVFPISMGFIMIDLFDYKSVIDHKNGMKSVPCSIFNQNRLVGIMPGLRPDCLPLMSAILGNDFVESGTFDNICRDILAMPYNGPLRANSFNHKKICKVLSWLKGKSLHENMEQILDKVRDRDRSKISGYIKTLLNCYHIEASVDLKTELDEKYPLTPDNQHNKELETNLRPSSYLTKIIERGCPSMALDMIFGNTYYSSTPVDDLNLPCSGYVRYRPMAVALTLLRNRSLSNMTTNQRELELQKQSFNIYDRLGTEYRKLIIKPLEKLENFGSVQHLNCYTLVSLDAELKHQILTCVFRFNRHEYELMSDTMSRVFAKSFVHDSSIVFLLIKYIGIESKMLPKREFVISLVLTLFYYAALNNGLNMDSFKGPHYGNLLLRLRPHSMMKNNVQYSPSKGLYRRIMHFISQLKAALNMYSLLNSLLDNPQPPARFDKYFNGVLMFRITKLLRNSDLKLEQLCESMDSLHDTCNSTPLLVGCQD